jgi:DNA-binding FadR family transcriptional regulator
MSVQDSSRSDTLGALADSVVGRVPLNKLPLLLADKLEEEFLRDGWPEGLSLGAEQALASRYGVGRDVLREVVRLLEARNHARMRRGPHGGLEVVRPDLDDLTARLAGYAYVSQLDRAQVLDAWLVLEAAAVKLLGRGSAATALRSSRATTPRARGNALIRSAGSPLLATLADMIGDLLPSIVDQNREMSDLYPAEADVEFGTVRQRRKALVGKLNRTMDEGAFVAPLAPRASCFQHQAMHLVHDLMNVISPEAWASGELIGNEFDLADRFGVDKSIVRQAIRLMEDAETATALPGRGRGLVTRLPSTAPLGRLLCAFLVSHDIAISDGEQVFEALRIESTGLACERVTAEDRATLMAMADDLDLLRAPLPVAALQAFERLQQHVAYNRLLSLFVDGVKAFLTWRGEPLPLASDPIVESYRTHTKRVVAAICAGDDEAARRAEAAKLAALRAGRTAQKTILPARHAN